MQARKPLTRSRNHRVIAGVCGAIASSFGWNPTVVRLLYVIVSLLSAAFPGLLVYLVLWLLIPQADGRSAYSH